MGSLLLRRSPSSSIYKKLAINTLNHILFSKPLILSNPLVSHQLHTHVPTSSSDAAKSLPPPIFSSERAFHSGIPMKYGAALANYADPDERSHSIAPADEGLEISKLGISVEIVSALADRGITKLFPIQRAVLVPATQGKDMIGRARTGTGKTLAFGIPILDKIIKYNAIHGQGRNPLAIALAPTRELAKQVEKEFSLTAPKLDTLCVYGGVPLSNQMRTIEHGVDVIVGTPGRVIDLIQRGTLNLSEVQFVVLDEADQMLNVGFAENVETILGYITQKHQTMMFSATMPSWILKLTNKFLKSPVTVDLVGDSDQKLADGISLYTIEADMREKRAIIAPLITEHGNGGKCIIFTQRKRDADELAYVMKRNFKCEALHGDISQVQREITLSSFRDGRINVLVATDVAARGLDVPNVELVIHYELPVSSEMFVHRTGRTGRAGKKGNAILIYSSHQEREIKSVEREVGCTFTELPRIAVDAEAIEMCASNVGARFGGGQGFGRTGGYGNSGTGRFGGSSSHYGGSGSRSGGFGSSQSGSYGGFGSGNYGGFGSNGSSGGFSRSGGSGGFGTSGGGGGFGKSGGFGSGGASGYGY